MWRRFTQSVFTDKKCDCSCHPLQLKLHRIFAAVARRLSEMATLETLNFDNLALRSLPIDPNEDNRVRPVSGACFSKVEPTKVKKPSVVAYSQPAMSLLDLPQSQMERPDVAMYFSGNVLLPGAETAAHCYCGHQFGMFAGQLGDGAAMYLGEVVNKKGERWEIQFKGSGLTPYSRTADGRKVLRSTIREFLCSEVMHFLGIPTTRAGTCVTSESKVTRDIFYNGNPIEEKCSIVLRLAPTFLRFGSFEIFKPTDPETGRKGPSVGKIELLHQLLAYTIKTFYTQIWESHKDHQETMYLEFFKEVTRRTARLVAEWQCVGWCHGVLNTDNMSIVGVTIDYGPYGFMDSFNPEFICNGSGENAYKSPKEDVYSIDLKPLQAYAACSVKIAWKRVRHGPASNAVFALRASLANDDGGRYTYEKQPEICKWNCRKLAEAIQEAIPLSVTEPALEVFDEEFARHYKMKMRKKLGLLKEIPEDSDLVSSLMDTMASTGSDFTNTFRCLSRMSLPGCPTFDRDIQEVTDYLLTQCSTLEELRKVNAPKMDPGQLQMIMLLTQSNPGLLPMLSRGFISLTKEIERMQKLEELKDVTTEEKRKQDREAWQAWLLKYQTRLKLEVQGGADVVGLNKKRVDIMNNTNPRFVLRNYIAENAIKAAEKGDYSEVNRVLKHFEDPFSSETDPGEAPSHVGGASVVADDADAASSSVDPPKSSSSSSCSKTDSSYDSKPPTWAFDLRVT